MTRKYPMRGALVVLSLSMLGAVGCGGRGTPLPVDGVLTWEDGKPISGASVRFIPEASGAREAVGYTGPDGKFDLTTYSARDGANPGEYRVVVTKAGPAPAVSDGPVGDDPDAIKKAMQKFHEKSKAAAPKAFTPVPDTYTNEKTTPLKWKVEAGNQKPELKIKRG